MELQLIQERIYKIGGMRVMLDFDLAELYDVETRTLKQAVRRNRDRFPADFMFQLTSQEWTKLISTNSDLPESVKYSPAKPFAFTEQGVAMLSAVLKSKKAIQVNIAIMRTFVMLRQHLADYQEIKDQIRALEEENDSKFKDIYEVINFLAGVEKEREMQQNRKRIGFKKEVVDNGEAGE